MNKQNNKIKLHFKLLIFFISMFIVYQVVCRFVTLSVQYSSYEKGTMQLFYDNKQDYPFDLNHSKFNTIKDTEDKFKDINFLVNINSCKKLRLDFDNINSITISNIRLSLFGIKLNEFNAEEILSVLTEIYDLTLEGENNLILVKDIGNDGYVASDNTKINTTPIQILVIAISIIISIFTTMVILKVLKKLDININIKSKRQLLLIIVFSIFIIGPNVIYPFIPESYKENSENRVLKEKPKFSIDNLTEYPQEYQEYYEDNLPFKDLLVRINSFVKYNIFNTSPAKYVIKGNDGWLFYNSKYKDDGDTLSDYQGTNLYTEDELQEIKNNLLDKYSFLKENNIELCIMVIPNKSNIYYENMPEEYYRNEDLSRADQTVNFLKENTSINIIYPKNEFLAIKDKYQIYSKIDSHWNSIGSYIAYCQFMKSIDSEFEYKSLDELDIIEEDIKTGDLASMINLNGYLNDKNYTIKGINDDIEISLAENKGYAMNRYLSTNKNGKKVLVYRDSFFVNLAPYIVKEFEETALVWGEPFSKEQIEEEKPDLVIIEVAERKLENLTK